MFGAKTMPTIPINEVQDCGESHNDRTEVNIGRITDVAHFFNYAPRTASCIVGTQHILDQT